MALGFDGSINIDTHIDTKGVAKGTKSIGLSLSGVMRSLKILGALMGVVFSGRAIFNFVQNAMSSFDLMKSSIGGNLKNIKTAFTGLQSALANVGVVLLTQLTPYIIIVIGWLTKLFTTLAALIQVLFGVKAGMGAVADETKDAGKSAKGALASFDQLNVLQKDTGDTGLPGLPGLNIPPELLAKIEAFKQKMLEFLQPVIEALSRLRDALIPLGETIWAGLKWAWDNILVPLGTWVITDLLPAFLDLIGAAAGVLNEALIALQPTWQWIWDNLLLPAAQWTGKVIIDALKWLTERLNDLSAWIKENPEKFQTIVDIVLGFAAAVWLLIKAWEAAEIIFAIVTGVASLFGIVLTLTVGQVFLVIAAVIALIAAIVWLITHWDLVKEKSAEVWNTITQLWAIAKWWFVTNVGEPIASAFMQALANIKNAWLNSVAWFRDNVINPLKSAFDIGLSWIENKFTVIFDNIKGFVKAIMNSIIDVMNGLISGVAEGINNFINAANSIGGLIPGYNFIPNVDAPQIPHLATGAVIPPNAAFAAILGDQKSGVNIEAPEPLIRKIISEELSNMPDRKITIEFTGSLSPLVRELHPLIKQETIRQGGSLIKSGVTV